MPNVQKNVPCDGGEYHCVVDIDIDGFDCDRIAFVFCGSLDGWICHFRFELNSNVCLGVIRKWRDGRIVRCCVGELIVIVLF